MITPFVTPAWLADHPSAVLADVRWYGAARPGRAGYDEGHLPGAVFVDLDADLAAPASADQGRHPLPTPEDFAAAMGRLGIGDDDVVVAYDDDANAIAARLVWMLRVTGHQAALLDGGLTGWDGPLDHGAVTRERQHFTARPWPASLLAGMDDLTDGVLLDARPAERFRGDVEPLDARPGHVPGARNVPCRQNVDTAGRLLPDEVLRERLGAVGVGQDTAWTSSCGSGVTACHTLLVAERLGLPAGRLYPGSWSQWAATDRPAERG